MEMLINNETAAWYDAFPYGDGWPLFGDVEGGSDNLDPDRAPEFTGDLPLHSAWDDTIPAMFDNKWLPVTPASVRAVIESHTYRF